MNSSPDMIQKTRFALRDDARRLASKAAHSRSPAHAMISVMHASTIRGGQRCHPVSGSISESSDTNVSARLGDLRIASARSSIDVAALAIDPPAGRRPFHGHAAIAADRRVTSAPNRSRVRIPVVIAEQTPNPAHGQPALYTRRYIAETAQTDESYWRRPRQPYDSAGSPSLTRVLDRGYQPRQERGGRRTMIEGSRRSMGRDRHLDRSGRRIPTLIVTAPRSIQSSDRKLRP